MFNDILQDARGIYAPIIGLVVMTFALVVLALAHGIDWIGMKLHGAAENLMSH